MRSERAVIVGREYRLIKLLPPLKGKGQYVLCTDGEGGQYIYPEALWLRREARPAWTPFSSPCPSPGRAPCPVRRAATPELWHQVKLADSDSSSSRIYDGQDYLETFNPGCVGCGSSNRKHIIKL